MLYGHLNVNISYPEGHHLHPISKQSTSPAFVPHRPLETPCFLRRHAYVTSNLGCVNKVIICILDAAAGHVISRNVASEVHYCGAVVGGLYQTKLVLRVRMGTVWPALEFGCGLQMIAKRDRDGTLEWRHAQFSFIPLFFPRLR